MFNALYNNSPIKRNLRDPDGTMSSHTHSPHAIVKSEEMSNVTEAIRRIEANTCIRFKERTNEHDYIEIHNWFDQGCYTNVGRIGGKGILMLESNYLHTCMQTETILHELMHVIGLWHEHMRYDRDKYIKVHFENIKKGYSSQFNRVSPIQATTYNVSYDYKSIMHYDETSFAIEGRISMETLDPRFQKVIGTQTDASPSDYKKICEIYQCQKCMDGSVSTDNEDVGSSVVEPPSTDLGGHGVCQDRDLTYCNSMTQSNAPACSSFLDWLKCCHTCVVFRNTLPNILVF